MVEVFHRVLFKDGADGINHPMITSWMGGNFESFHFAPHQAWMDKWEETHSLNPADYPLYESEHAYYSPNARLAFFELVQGQGNEEVNERRARMMVGVSAFRTPEGASQYSANSMDNSVIVSFRGVFVCPLAEHEDGGVQAIVIEPISDPLSQEEFRLLHGLQIPPPPEPNPDADPIGEDGETILPYDEEQP